jgi:D-alanine-D-alanine ligase
MPKIKVAILSGGKSSERDIALQSAKNVLQKIKQRFDIKFFDFPKDIDTFYKTHKDFSVAIPIFHGPGGEDGVIQSFLKTLDMPFIFSDVKAHAIGMDKVLSKILITKHNLLTPDYKLINTQTEFIKPVVVKPLAGGSSIGISIANNQTELDKAITTALQYDDQVLLEDYIQGQEYTVVIVEQNKKIRALPVIQIKSNNDFFDYASKYNPKLVEEICPAVISDDLAKNLQEQSIKIHQIIGCRHLSRSDFIVSNKQIYFLEINTIPGMTKKSLLPKAIKAANLDFTDLLEEWIKDLSKC